MTDESKELKKECCMEAEDCCRHKHREANEVKALTKRLNRIEGQVRGIRGMVKMRPTAPTSSPRSLPFSRR